MPSKLADPLGDRLALLEACRIAVGADQQVANLVG
jgi:hypothetical protein